MFPTPIPAALRFASGCLFVSCLGGSSPARAQAGGGIPAGKIFLYSGTFTQSLMAAERGPRNLITTYYQAEGEWPLAPWVKVEFEVEGGQIVGDNHAESLGSSLGAAFRLNACRRNPNSSCRIFS